MSLGKALVIAARELGSFFYTPAGAVIGAAFLLVQGVSFWGLIDVLADPSVPAPYGAVLSSYFGGTVIYWSILFALTSALTMRLFAEERHAGTWETLCTAGVTDASIATGKCAAAYAIYLALWVPTILFIAVIELFAPAGAGIDSGPIASAYLGVAVIGAAAVALGALASALTNKQMIAALTSFAISMLVLLVGELTSFGLSARADMFELASGLVRPVTIARYVALTAALAVAIYAAVAIGRRTSAEVVRRVALALAITAAAAALVALSARAPTLDLTSARVHTLEPETRTTLARVGAPVDVLILEPTIPGFAAVFVAIEGVLSRMHEAQPLLRVRRIDPAEGDADVAAIARDLGLDPEPLRAGGAVIFESAGRRRLLDVTAVAGFDSDPLGVGRIATFWAESAFAQAIAEISDDRRHLVCVATDVGLSTEDEGDAGLDWSSVAELLRRDGVTVREVALDGESTADCDAIAVVGADVAIEPSAALVVFEHVRKGGSLLLAARSEKIDLAPVAGLELVLDHFGVAVKPAVVVDPDAEVGVANVWATRTGYGDHPITRPFARRSIETVWPAPRAVTAEGGVALVKSSSRSWAESDVEAVFSGDDVAADAGEALGAISVAVAAELADGARIVVLGSAEVAASQFVGRGLGAGHILAARSLLWLVGRDVDVAISDKTPEHVRLIMSRTARRVTFAVTVICVPLAWLGLFLALLWWRRRESP